MHHKLQFFYNAANLNFKLKVVIMNKNKSLKAKIYICHF